VWCVVASWLVLLLLRSVVRSSPHAGMLPSSPWSLSVACVSASPSSSRTRPDAGEAANAGRKQPHRGHRLLVEADVVLTDHRVFVRAGQHGDVVALDGGGEPADHVRSNTAQPTFSTRVCCVSATTLGVVCATIVRSWRPPFSTVLKSEFCVLDVRGVVR
jgi:hypothetical protein